MAEGNPFAPNNVSPWIITTPGPELVRHNVREAGHQRLLAEAETLRPNEVELVKQLTDKKLDPATANAFGSMLSEGLKNFSKEYGKNPFYAFSREGRNTVAGLQQLVRDPKLAAAEKAYADTQEQWKELKKNEMLKMLDVQNGMIRVIDNETGEYDFVTPEAAKNGNYTIYDLERLHNYANNRRGFYNKDLTKIVPLTHSMLPKEKVDEQVLKYLGGVGSTTVEKLGRLSEELKNSPVDVTVKGNSAQIKSRVRALLDEAGGLPQAARDTIYSMYYSAAGRDATSAGAEAALVNYVVGIAQGELESSETYSASKVAETNARDFAQKNLTPNGYIGDIATGITTAPQYETWRMNGKEITTPAAPVPKAFFQETTATWDDDGVKRPAMTLGSVKGLGPISNADLYIKDLRSGHEGELVPLPKHWALNRNAIVIDDRQDASYIPNVYQKPVTGSDDRPTGGFVVEGNKKVEYDVIVQNGQPRRVPKKNQMSQRALRIPVMVQTGTDNDQWAEAYKEMLKYNYGEKETSNLSSDELKKLRAKIAAAGGVSYGQEMGYVPLLNTDDVMQFEVIAVFEDPALLDASAQGLPATHRSKFGLPPPDLATLGGESSVGSGTQRRPFDNTSFSDAVLDNWK